MKKVLLKGGMLISKADGFHEDKKDILIEDGKIASIEDHIEPEADTEVIDVTGSYVSAGFIDCHVHVYHKAHLGVPADLIGVDKGVTTVIDAGSAGPGNIRDFIDTDIKNSKTRIYSAMHYATDGLIDPPEADDESKYDLELGKKAYVENKEHIVAIKERASQSCVGDLGIVSIRAGKKLAKELGLPVMVHIGHMPPTIEDVLDTMEEGDVITHAFHGKDNNLFDNGKIKPQTQAARDRGVLFDIGHGKDSFNFETGKLAKSLGFYPDIISTDLHSISWLGPVYSLPVTMDKFLALGYSLEDCVDKVTAAPARIYKLPGLGHIRKGDKADFTVFTVTKGHYVFMDANKNVLEGTESIEVELALKEGEIVMKRELKPLEIKVIDELKSRDEWTPADFEKYGDDLRDVLILMRDRNVFFEEGNLLAFTNHVMTLFRRLETGEKVDALDESILEEINYKAMEVAKELVSRYASKYGEADMTELVLLAIHIQTAQEQFEESLKH